MRHQLLTPFLVGSLLLLGCGQESPVPTEGERVQSDDSAIINGQLDATHTAVVAVLAPDFECTGTVLQVTGGIGYVLTAAHCCPAGDLPTEVVIGPDYNTGVSHQIVPGSVNKDPCYLDFAGGTDDVCMLKFKNATGVPTIPAMSSQTDTLAIGTPITYVGYGITAAPPGGGNSLRRRVDKTIGGLDTYFVEYASAGQSGTCEGDSGGPGIVTINGQEMVASVTSFGDKQCNQLGTSMRTSAVYTSFIAPYLADQPSNPVCPITFDCNVCSQAATQHAGCTDVTNKCFNDAQCSALAQCYQTCTSTACINACNTAHVGGLQKYEAINSCICTGACPQACGQTSTCTGPKCGLKVTDGTCKTCVESACCAEAWECQSDATCKKCFTTAAAPAACATNAKAAAYYACAKTTCACNVNDPANAGGTTSAASSSAASTGSGEMTTSGAGGSGGAGGEASTATTTVAGVGGAASATAASGTGGSGTDTQVGGCACSTADRGEGSMAPFAALAVGAIGIVARRRRRVG
jgi:MYXO-CTERM domain-containing protein